MRYNDTAAQRSGTTPFDADDVQSTGIAMKSTPVL